MNSLSPNGQSPAQDASGGDFHNNGPPLSPLEKFPLKCTAAKNIDSASN
jgi:hypothetical protein